LRGFGPGRGGEGLEHALNRRLGQKTVVAMSTE
jgi:hypothetical protein